MDVVGMDVSPERALPRLESNDALPLAMRMET